jgi:hypothetical protein
MGCGPTAAELAAIRSDVAALALDLSCEIQRKTITKDQYGTQTEIWNTISPDNLKVGMTEPSAGQLQNYEYVIGSLETWRVQLPYTTDVQLQDHLIVGGKTLTIQVDLTPKSYAALLTVLASKVEGQVDGG